MLNTLQRDREKRFLLILLLKGKFFITPFHIPLKISNLKKKSYFMLGHGENKHC